MNIGNYKPDGNIMTVPEIKEIVTEGVDISDLKDNVTTLNEAVGELEEELTGTIADVNEMGADLDNIFDDVADLNAVVEGLASNKIGKYVAGDEIVLGGIITSGLITANSREIRFFIPNNRVDYDKYKYTVDDLSLSTRFVDGIYGFANFGGTYTQLGAGVVSLWENGNSTGALESVSSSATIGDGGINIFIVFNESIKTTSGGSTAVKNNTPVALTVSATINVTAK